ncbi:MAG: GNAT family N-acetyltransferase, partial [Candidatus Acidiferrales bacterium]
MRSDDITAAAWLHYELIGRTGTGSLASLGVSFLERVFYGANMRNPHFFCDVAAAEGRLVGFSVYTDDRARILNPRMALATAGFALRCPSSIPVLLYSVNGEKAPKAAKKIRGQWLVCAIEPEHRSNGVADSFIQAMERRLRHRCESWLGVARLNPPINKLLLRHGAKFIGTGKTQGTTFNYYV